MIQGINHITFAVKDINKSLEFYHNILGCELIATCDKGAYLQAGVLWLCLSLDANALQEQPSHYSHIAFNINPNDFTAMEKRLIENNVQFWKDNVSEGDSLYILDPDFHKLEVHYSTLANRLRAMKDKPYQSQQIYKDIADA